MHKRLEPELLPVDTKIERTLRNLKTVKVAERAVMAEQEGTSAHYNSQKRCFWHVNSAFYSEKHATTSGNALAAA